jgi:hypothetical protein
MTKTPFSDLKSTDILSAHISGLQHSINKLEGVLNMLTTPVTNHPLVAVADQDDATLRYRIYEGTIRNWLAGATVKRGGLIVPASEYDIHPAYGAVIFKVQQDSSAAITADFTYVREASKVLADLQAATASIPVGMSGAFFHYPGTYRTHSIGNDGDYVKLVSSDGITENDNYVTAVDFVGQSATSKGLFYNPGYASGILAAAGEIEFFPFPVTERTTYDKMMIKCSVGTYTSNIMMAVYTHENGKPGTLIAKSALTTFFSNIVRELDFQGGEITLEPGMYWIARASSASMKYDRCINAQNAIKIGDFGTATGTFGGTSSNHQYAGIRTSGAAFTNDLPANTSGLTMNLLKRAQYCSPWIRRKA